MFFISRGQSLVKSNNTLLINLNGLMGLTALGYTTTALLAAAMGQLTMEYLNNAQEDLSAQGYHDRESMIAGKFNLLTDATTRRRLLVANPALTQMYSAADFAKGGAFYSYGITAGCGDWLFKEDKMQMRFRFRQDLDGQTINGVGSATSVWVEQVQPFENVAATFGKKPVYSTMWKNAPIRLYHCYNRDAREVFVGDITSVNDEMKFGLARSFMGEWSWHSPDVIITQDPNTGSTCTLNNDKKNMGYWLGEYRFGEKTVYPEIERMILALGEPQPYVRIPRTNTAPNGPSFDSTTDAYYQSLLAYCAKCDEFIDPTQTIPYNPDVGFVVPQED